MDLEEAIKGMLKTRELLRNTKGITDPQYISEQMQRLTQYAGAVEEHLAELEEQHGEEEYKIFSSFLDQGKSVNQAEILAKGELKPLKAKIAKLKRYCSSSWDIIGVAQSRVNHLTSEYKLGSKTT